MEHTLYITAIKKALKSRGMTYADLAFSLKMTESGIKKMLNSKDISFQRIIQICKVLNILPGQFFSLSEKSSLPILHLTDKQEFSLLNDRKLLAAYWLITIEKKSVDEMAHYLKSSSAEIKQRLQKLVSLDLVSQKKGQFLPKHQGKFRWPDHSKLALLLNKEWSEQTLKKALSSQRKENSFHRFAALKLSIESHDRLQKRFTDLFDEMAQLSAREELTVSRQNLFDFTIVLASTNSGVFES